MRNSRRVQIVYVSKSTPIVYHGEVSTVCFHYPNHIYKRSALTVLLFVIIFAVIEICIPHIRLLITTERFIVA